MADHGDSARPETISYLQRHGFPRIGPAVKGPNSVKEGVIFLQGYDIIVHPRCPHTIDELMHYSYTVDKASGMVTLNLADKKNHVIESRFVCDRGASWSCGCFMGDVVNNSEHLKEALASLPQLPPLDSLRTAEEFRSAASVVMQRWAFFNEAGVTFGGARDAYRGPGYRRVLTNRDYRDRYERGGVAGRVVDVMPDATWRGTVEVREDKDEKTDTPFEAAWKALDKRLQVQAKLRRVDKLSRLSNYAVLLIGARARCRRSCRVAPARSGTLPHAVLRGRRSRWRGAQPQHRDGR